MESPLKDKLTQVDEALFNLLWLSLIWVALE